MTPEEQIALDRYNSGEKPGVSTLIDDDTITMGYGDIVYDFEYPLPYEIIIEKYGTTSWKQHFANKGLHQYLTINKKDEKESISPYWTDEELQKHIELNPGFKFEKL